MFAFWFDNWSFWEAVEKIYEFLSYYYSQWVKFYETRASPSFCGQPLFSESPTNPLYPLNVPPSIHWILACELL